MYYGTSTMSICQSQNTTGIQFVNSTHGNSLIMPNSHIQDTEHYCGSCKAPALITLRPSSAANDTLWLLYQPLPKESCEPQKPRSQGFRNHGVCRGTSCSMCWCNIYPAMAQKCTFWSFSSQGVSIKIINSSPIWRIGWQTTKCQILWDGDKIVPLNVFCVNMAAATAIKLH